MTDASDRDHQIALLKRVAAEDKAAFAELFSLFAPRVKGFLIRSLGNEGKADEITQEVMLRVWRRASSYDPGRAAPSTWIFTIARNARTDVLRKERHPEPDPEDPCWVPAAPDAPDDVAEREQSGRRVRDAVAERPEGQAAILQAAYFQGQTLAAISEAQNLPLGTVKSRVRLAMKRLRAALET